jgi:ketoreductase RED2
VVNSSKSVSEGEALSAELRGSTYIQADISDPLQATRLVEETVSRLGRLDVLINNAGTTVVIPHNDIDAVTPEIWRRILDLNVIGTWQVTAAAIPHLRESGEGCIVNVSSVAGERPTGSSIPYAVSKAAISHMTRLLANVLGPEIRVNAVAPGLVDTPWTEDWTDLRALVAAAAPLRRTATSKDVSDVICALVRAAYVTGEVLIVDGGIHLR